MRNRGSTLIVVAVLVMLIGALSAAFQVASVTFFRSSSTSTDQQLAVLAAQSGAAYYVRHVQENPGYFNTNPAPHATMPMGAAVFALESATDIAGAWKLVIIGRNGAAQYRLGSTIGKPFIEIPEGLVVGGLGGTPSDITFSLSNDSLMASYHPSDGPFDPLTAGDVAHLGVNGSMSIDSLSSIDGDVSLTGTLASGDPTSIGGDLTESAPEETVESIDPYVASVLASSKAANDNANLSSVFGAMWTPYDPSGENYGDLIVNDGGTYVVPAGVYRFRQMEVTNGSTVIFDTSGGDSEIVYIGWTRPDYDDLTVDGSSAIKIDPGGTDNGLLTVIHQDSDLRITDGSMFGQAIGDENNAGYNQIVSMGGDSSLDPIEIAGGSTVYGRIYASVHSLDLSGGSTLYGSALVGQARIDNSTFAVDLGTLGVQLEAKSSNAQMLGYWDE